MLNPQPEAEDHIFNCPLPLSEWNSTLPSAVSVHSISPSKPTRYKEYPTKLTGDCSSESMNNISFISQSDKPQLPRLSNAAKY